MWKKHGSPENDLRQFLNHDGSRYTTVTAWMETIEVRGIFQDMDRNSDRFW